MRFRRSTWSELSSAAAAARPVARQDLDVGQGDVQLDHADHRAALLVEVERRLGQPAGRGQVAAVAGDVRLPRADVHLVGRVVHGDVLRHAPGRTSSTRSAGRAASSTRCRACAWPAPPPPGSRRRAPRPSDWLQRLLGLAVGAVVAQDVGQGGEGEGQAPAVAHLAQDVVRPADHGDRAVLQAAAPELAGHRAEALRLAPGRLHLAGVLQGGDQRGPGAGVAHVEEEHAAAAADAGDQVRFAGRQHAERAVEIGEADGLVRRPPGRCPAPAARRPRRAVAHRACAGQGQLHDAVGGLHVHRLVAQPGDAQPAVDGVEVGPRLGEGEETAVVAGRRSSRRGRAGP